MAGTDTVLHGPKRCDHRTEALGERIGGYCMCDYGDCRHGAVRFVVVSGTHLHYCPEHADEKEKNDGHTAG